MSKANHIGTAPLYSSHPTAGLVPIFGWRPHRVGTRYFYDKDFPQCTLERGFRWRNDEEWRRMLALSEKARQEETGA